MTEFFTRPWLLLLAPLIYWLVLRLVRQSTATTGWQHILPPALAERLLTSGNPAREQPVLSERWVALLLALLFSLSLAGIGKSLNTEHLPRLQQEVVILQYLSPPVRGNNDAWRQLETSQQLLVPLLNERRHGQTALLYYAGSAHLASPMTDDAATLRQLFSLSHPSVMPLGGNQPEAAFRLAAASGRLADQPGRAGSLHWIWLTPNLPTDAEWARLLNLLPGNAQLHLVWLDASLSQVLQQRERLQVSAAVELLAVEQAAERLAALNQQAASRTITEDSAWLFREQGHWLLLTALLLLLWQALGQPRLSSRVLPLALLLLLLPPPAQAVVTQHPDRQAWRALQNEMPDRALQLAQRPDLQGHALFRLQRFTEAAEHFEAWLQQADRPQRDEARQAADLFNAGTSWLLAGNSQQALAQLQQAVDLQPQWPEACFNLQLARAVDARQSLPDTAILQRLCSSGTPQAASDSDSSGADAQPQWQPQRQASCPGCDPLTEAQEQQLEQLQDDPWRLLRLRFQNELREQQP